MDILSPNHAHFGLSDNGVNYGVVNGDNAFITNEIVIGERNSYYVFIGGVELTKQLCEDQDALIELLIESDEQLMEDFFEGISEIYYIPEAKTLHMKNFRMNFADNEGIKNGGFIRGANRHGVLDLNIEIEGDCSLTSHGTVPLYVFNGPTTLTGNGTLTIHSDYNMGVCCYDDFTLYGPTLVTDGTMGFYSYDNEKSPTAKIFMGTLRAKGSEKSFYAQHLNLSSAVKITDPVGAYWDETSFNVVNAGGSIVKNEWVVFESSTATGISDEGVRMKNDGWNATDVYDLQGRRISTSPQALKHGIYIINGQKVVVR